VLVISETKHLFKDGFSASHFRNKTFINEQLITSKCYTPSPSNHQCDEYFNIKKRLKKLVFLLSLVFKLGWGGGAFRKGD